MTDEEIIKLHKDMMLGVEAGYQYPPKVAQLMANRIRALAMSDQTAALDRVKAEAKAEGMRTAARITRVESERLPISLHDAALKCEAAILAATPNEFGIILGSADKLRAAIAAAKGEVI